MFISKLLNTENNTYARSRITSTDNSYLTTQIDSICDKEKNTRDFPLEVNPSKDCRLERLSSRAVLAVLNGEKEREVVGMRKETQC